jgi:hypothetical protein
MISDVKAYARARFATGGALAGNRRREHADGFNWKNIAKTLLDTSYVLELGQVVGVRNNQADLEMSVPLTVRLFMSPSRDPKTLIDEAILEGEQTVVAFVNTPTRLNAAGIKNVLFNNLAIEALDGSNDNGLIIRIDFTMLVIASTV